MRKFFVYFLILGVLATTALLTRAQLPDYITTGSLEKGHFVARASLSGGSLEANLTNAKREVARKIFNNAKTLLNGEQQKPKNMWVPAEYKTTLDNLEKMRLEKSHLAHLIRERRESKWVYVNVKNHEATRAYLDLQNDLKRQINGLLTNAAQMEAVNPQQALQPYLKTYPLYERLKEATLLEQSTRLQQNHDPTAAIAKLIEAARGTSGGELGMSFPDVTQRVNQIQHQGRLIDDVHQIGRSIAEQLSVQASGMKKGKVTFSGFNYKNSSQHTAVSGDLMATLIQLLENDGWNVVPPVRGALPMEVSINIQGAFQDGVHGLQCQTTAYNVDTGHTVVNSVVNLDPGFEAQLKPGNYDALQTHEVAAQSIKIDTHALQRAVLPRTFTGQELHLQAWTDKQIYYEGDRMDVLCRVNQPAYVRLIYVLADPDGQGPQYTLLHDNHHVQQVGSDVIIGQFRIAPPFGSEELIVLAQKDPFPRISTVKVGGYNYIDAQNTQAALAMIHRPTRGALPMNENNERLPILTQAKK